jgi:hypothetical protein
LSSKVQSPVKSTLSRDRQGPRAVLNALERLAGGYGSECVRVRQDLGIFESQLRDYQARLGKPFLHDAYRSELISLRDQLKTGLSATAQMQDDEAGPSVSDLADKIKSLKAAHSIEATPQRARQKHSSAEEPVTARIRRRQETLPATDPAIDSEAAASGEGAAPPPESTAPTTPGDLTPGIPADHTSATQDCSMRPELTFQKLVARSRRENEHGPAVTR